MIRIIILVACIAIVVFVLTKFYGMLKLNQCSKCDGLGYWDGTRGERNQCRVCSGTGKG